VSTSAVEKQRFIYVVGGREKSNRDLPEYRHYERGIILRVDPGSGSATTVVDYVSPATVLPDEEPSIVFKAGSLSGDLLYVCTQTEVLSYRVPTFERIDYVTLPCFNDVHHVSPTPRGTLLVAVTGLDLVIEMTRGGEIVREWDTLGEPLWSRFSRTIDYRKIVTTQPHRVHPNFVFIIDGEYWVTRLEQQDAISLTGAAKRINIAVERPHDGIVAHGRIYFTTVDGHVVIADPGTQAVFQIVDLQEIMGTDLPLGWCRGLKVIDRDHIVVGFTRIRPTMLKRNVAWVRDKLKRLSGLPPVDFVFMPTRLCCISLVERRCLWEIDLERHGMNAVFSIH
jgi:hypothetical protein